MFINSTDGKRIKELVKELNSITSLSERGSTEILQDFIDIVKTYTKDEGLASGICITMIRYSLLVHNDRGKIIADKVIRYIEECILVHQLSTGGHR